MNYIEKWNQEKIEALRSLNIKKIKKYCTKYSIAIPKDDTVLLSGIHKARLATNEMTEEEKEFSRMWLKKHNFKEQMF